MEVDINGNRGGITGGTGVLVGRYDHALDPKKRLTVPAGWRDLMGSPPYIYVFPDPNERCLNLIPPAEMEGRLEKLRQAALFDKTLGPALQALGEHAEQLMVDVQGRVRISDRLLKFASLETMVAMIGAMNRIKLWSPAVMPPEDAVDQAKLAAACALLNF